MGQDSRKVALITGISGQLGSYAAELLLSKDYFIHGLVRPSSDVVASRERIEGFANDPRVELHYGDLCDQSGLVRLLGKVQPDEIYNLAAQSHVAISFQLPLATADVTGLGALRLFEAVREACPEARVYQASSSEMFGDSPPPQNELTPFAPRSPYAAAKLFAFHAAKNYREAYGLHISNGILFNSESPRRGPGFVTRKISRAVARFCHGHDEPLRLGNLYACRDWMHAKDAVRGMWLMLQQEKPDDYVLATGQSHSVKWFLSLAAACVERSVRVTDEFGEARFGACGPWPGHVRVEVDDRYLRPTEVPHLRGDATKAREKLGWQPEITLEQLVKEMVEEDLRREGKV